jgi:hypothetical protein
VRRWICVPMMTLCLLLGGCGGTAEDAALSARRPYQEMTGCTMEAEVRTGAGASDVAEFTLRCDYTPEGGSTVEVLAPEEIAGVRAVIDGETWALTYEDLCLNAGTLGSERISPAACLPRMMEALRTGWLLEENTENWNDVPCLRLAMDETGEDGGKIVTTLYLREDDGTPLYGEIGTDGEIILTAEFTDFQFRDILEGK